MDVSLIAGHDNSIQTNEKHGIACDGKTAAEENAKKSVIFYGPWGGCGGDAWNDGCLYTGVREIELSYGDCINSIRVIYDMNGDPVPGPRHGGNGGTYGKTIWLNRPWEYLVSIRGYYGHMGCHVVVRSLTFIIQEVTSLVFTTREKTYGPYGVEMGTPFCIPIKGTIKGFKGRSGSYLDQIGVYVA